MAKVLTEKINNIVLLAPSIYKITVESSYVAHNAKPGQFVNVKCSEGLNALLRRPISICSVDREKGTFDFVFQVRGIGTEYLSKKRSGDIIDYIAPLGQAFELSKEYKKIAVIGGGIGIFPLLFLLEQSRAEEKTAFLGFRSSKQAVMLEEFTRETDNLYIASDDGTIGLKGLVTDVFLEVLNKNEYDIIYACGPLPMLKTAAKEAQQRKIPCQVSLEQRMGCGIGACLVCACKTRLGDEWEYSHVCKDGPVFWSDRVIFD